MVSGSFVLVMVNTVEGEGERGEEVLDLSRMGLCSMYVPLVVAGGERDVVNVSAGFGPSVDSMEVFLS